MRPLKQDISDGGDFYQDKHCRDDDDDQEDSLEGESSSGIACGGASSDDSADSSSDRFLEDRSNWAEMGGNDSSDTTVNGPCPPGRK